MFKKRALNFVWRLVQPMVKIYLEVTKKCSFDKGSQISYLSTFKGRNSVGRNTYFIQSELGYASYVSFDAFLFNAKVGKYSSIGPRVTTINGQHPVNRYVSTHPAFYATKNESGISYVNGNRFEENQYVTGSHYSVVIGNDVWIGADVKIMEGVTIGDGAVVAAGAMVLKDVEPYSIVAGCPVKVIRNRYDDKIVKLLLKHSWWDKTEEWLKQHAQLFEDISSFISYLEKECNE